MDGGTPWLVPTQGEDREDREAAIIRMFDDIAQASAKMCGAASTNYSIDPAWMRTRLGSLSDESVRELRRFLWLLWSNAC